MQMTVKYVTNTNKWDKILRCYLPLDNNIIILHCISLNTVRNPYDLLQAVIQNDEKLTYVLFRLYQIF